MQEFQQDRHEMIVVREGEAEGRELYCPTCGRTLLVNWKPDFQKVVLEPGDETAIHTGGTDGLRLRSTRIAPEGTPDADEQTRLQQWDRWLAGMNFSALWE